VNDGVNSVRHFAGSEQFVDSFDGITSWHCFSAGAHYDPQRLSFGPIVAFDEHLVAPGAGFDWHAHRGVTILSWVLAGTLRHEDGNALPGLVGPGSLFVQSGADGIRHRETNASTTEPLRFLQITLLGADGTSVTAARPPCSVGRVSVSLPARYAGRGPALVFAIGAEAGSGEWWELDGTTELETSRQLLVLEFTGPAVADRD
jgi:hypothetical protein